MPAVLSHLPNLLTISRGLAGPTILVLVLGFDLHELAFATFIVAVLTDLADGWVARVLKASSDLGKMLDPVADKMLVGATWLTLGLAGWAPWWLVGPMLARDLIIILGFFAIGAKLREPNLVGRLMVSVEGVALSIFLFRTPWMGTDWPSVAMVLGLMSLVLAVASAVLYGLDVLRGRGGSGEPSVLPPTSCPPPSTPT